MLLQQLIRERLEELGISQAEAARRAEFHYVNLSRWLTGKTAIKSDLLIRLLDVLDLQVTPKSRRMSRKTA